MTICYQENSLKPLLTVFNKVGHSWTTFIIDIILKASPHFEARLFIIQKCPTYKNERCSRGIRSEINMFSQYIILTICKHDTFCWIKTAFMEKNG